MKRVGADDAHTSRISQETRQESQIQTKESIIESTDDEQIQRSLQCLGDQNKAPGQVAGQISVQETTVDSLRSIQVKLLEYGNDFCTKLGSEVLRDRQPSSTMTPIVLSSDLHWRKVQLFVLILTRSDPQLMLQNSSDLISKLLAEVNQLAFAPYLLPNAGNSSKKSLTTDPCTALLEHRRLVAAVEIFLHLIATEHSYGQLLITFQLGDILTVLLQLCHAPIRNVSPSNSSPPSSVEGWLLHGDRVPESYQIEADYVVAEMQRDRLRHKGQLQRLTDTLFQPHIIDRFLRMLNPKSPNWFRKAVSSELSKEILRTNGLSNLLVAMEQVFDRDSPFSQLEKVAMLVSRAPSTTSDSEYSQEMGRQIREILHRPPTSNTQSRLLLSVINCFLTHKSYLSIESIFTACFTKFVALLKPEADPNLRITSKEIHDHLEIVDRTSQYLPKDSALVEAFALLLPIYLKMALFLMSLRPPKAEFYMGVVSNLASNLRDGAEVIVACLDDNNVRFQLPRMLRFSLVDDGDIEISAAGTAFTPSMECYHKFFGGFFVTNKELTTRIYLKLMESFIEAPDSSNDGSSFMAIASAILLELTPLCEGIISQNEEFSTEFLVQNLKKIPRADDPQSVLKLLEILVDKADQLSTVSKQRLVASVDFLQSVEGDFRSKALALSQTISEKLSDVEPFQPETPFTSWKFAPMLLKFLANKHWNLEENFTEERPHSPIELTKLEISRRRQTHASSVFGTMTEYQKVKDELLDPDVAIRGHGFIQLRKLLCARDAHILRDIASIFELCKLALNEDDSYVYLGAVQCYSQIVELHTSEYLPDLIETFMECQCTRTKLLLAETLNRCIPSFGEMSAVYSENIVRASIDCCRDPEELTRVCGCSLLGQTVPHLTNQSLYFRQSMSIFVLLITTDQSEIVRRAAAEGLTKALKVTDDAVLINDYPTEIRDIHRVIKGLYTKCTDDSLKVHFQEILLTLGALAKLLLHGSK